jgi:hypothetical protein
VGLTRRHADGLRQGERVITRRCVRQRGPKGLSPFGLCALHQGGGAEDHAGNTADKSIKYYVEYPGLSGILQPINDAVQEPIVENPSNGFRYDAGADQYIYNANFSDKAVGTCWKVVVTLDNGQVLESAIFKLQK